LGLAAVQDLRGRRQAATLEELEAFEVDVLAGYVLARASAGIGDSTIRGDIGHLDQVRSWFGKALWEMEPTDADTYFGRAAQLAEWDPPGPLSGVAHLLRVPRDPSCRRDPRHDGPFGAVPDR